LTLVAADVRLGVITPNIAKLSLSRAFGAFGEESDIQGWLVAQTFAKIPHWHAQTWRFGHSWARFFVKRVLPF